MFGARLVNKNLNNVYEHLTKDAADRIEK